MKAISLQTGLLITGLLASGGALFGFGDFRWLGTERAFAASAQQKAQARKALDQVIDSLSGVDTAYASGKAAEAQAKLVEARSGWNEVSPAIAAREARDAQLWFDSLETKLKSGVPAAEVNSTVYGMLEELSEDIAGELR